MVPASSLSEIIDNVTSLNLEPTTAAAVLGAVLTPLLRDSASELPQPRAGRPRSKLRKAPPPQPERKKRRATPSSDGRERARAALAANPNATLM